MFKCVTKELFYVGPSFNGGDLELDIRGTIK
jgi:hypothetical protein